MNFLPIVDRELRVAARRKGTYRARFSAASLALVVCGWIYLVEPRMQTSDLSRMMFSFLAGLAMFYALLAGNYFTADCVSEEKREGTMGLLFLTDLKGHDVVLGKLAATSMNAFYSLLAIFPVLAIPLLMGGIGVDDFWRMVLVLLNALFFSLSGGLFISGICRNERRAMATTFLLILLFTGGFPVLGALMMEYVFEHYDQELMLPFLLPSPGFGFVRALEAGFRGGVPMAFWWSLLTVHLLGWLWLALACLIVPQSWQERPASVPLLRWKERWQRWCYGGSAARKALRTRLLQINPFLWLAGRHRLQKAMLWGFLGLLGVGFSWGYVAWPDEWLSAPVAIMGALVLHATLKVWLASEAGHRLIEERRANALEVLLSTPLEVEDILRGQRMALNRLFAYPFLVVIVADCLLLWMGLSDTHSRSDRQELWMAFAVGIVMLIADYFAISWVGMWHGLSAKRTKNASATTILCLLIMPWLLFWASTVLYFALGEYFRPSWRSPPSFAGLALWWLVLGLITDLMFGLRAYVKLRWQFRTAATRRFQPPRPYWWRRLL